jgi:hypothetical protein
MCVTFGLEHMVVVAAAATAAALSVLGLPVAAAQQGRYVRAFRAQPMQPQSLCPPAVQINTASTLRVCRLLCSTGLGVERLFAICYLGWLGWLNPVVF